MASVTNISGNRLIQFADGQGIRRTIRLGKCSAKKADTVRLHIAELANAKLSGQPVDSATAHWLAGIGDILHAKLAAVGLCEGRKGKASATVRDMLRKYDELQLPHLKPATATFYGHTKRNLTKYFGSNRPLASITPIDADGFRAFLRKEDLATATVNRRVVAAKTVFRRALRWDMLPKNPFDGIVGGNSYNEDRKYFVKPADAMKLLDACPDAEWRVLVALSRFGGLRIPSEANGLTWADVDWDKGTLHVKSPKTEHHAGQASRILPLFPELRKALLEAFEAAEAGGEPWIISKHRGAGVNLRTHLERIILRAGLIPWPRLWHNMRASRQSELMAEYDLTTACRWLGNSPSVAARHYAMDTDTDGSFQRAVGQTSAKPERALQNALQYTAETARNGQQAESHEVQDRQYLQGNSDVCSDLHIKGMGVEGLEPSTLRV